MNVWFQRLVGSVLCVGICLGAMIQPLAASSGSITTLPAPTAPKSPTGLTISVDSRWVDGYGYRPIRVTVTASKPVPANQTITLRLKAGNWHKTPFISVDQDIELPAGTTAVSAIIAVPRDQPWDMLWWDVLVDGVFDSSLSLDHYQNTTLQQINRLWQNEGRPLILFVGKTSFSSTPALPIAVNLPTAGLLPPGSFSIGENSVTVEGSTITIDNMYNSGAGLNMATCSPPELPTRWIDYTALDAVAISADDLIRLQKDQPAALDAILDWTRTGGTLWIYGTGEEQQKIEALETALGSEPGKRNDTASDALDDRWKKMAVPRNSENSVPNDPMEGLDTAIFEDQVRRIFAGDRNAALYRRLGMGVLVLSARSLDNASEVDRFFSGQEILGQRTWIQRHNLQPDQPDPNFAKFLIPGVGLAPITEFRILITLFVLLIGPVNYWFLKRRKQLHLLVLSVPLAALAVTFALFVFAFFADGLSTRIRTHSLTLLDQAKDQAICWARLSYYAGLAPSGGLEFSTQVAVYPIFPEWIASGMFNRDVNIPSRAIQWQDKQYLTEGWLASRTPTQYLTIAARPSARRIDISIQPGRADITNKLDAAIDWLIVRGPDGELYWGESIGRDDESTLQPVDEAKAMVRVRQILSDHELQFPIGYQGRYGGLGQRVYPMNPNRQSEFEQAGSQMDRYLAALVAPGGPANRLLQIDNLTYLAVTRTGPEVELGISHYNEEASFHVIVGTWDESDINQ